MNKAFWLLSLIVALPLCLAGCSGTSDKAVAPSQAANSDAEEEKKIQETLSQLPPEDRKLAEEQRYCPESKHRLGEMGAPIKVTVDGQPVFVCCKGCVEDAEKDPKKTLERVKELKAKAAETGSH